MKIIKQDLAIEKLQYLYDFIELRNVWKSKEHLKFFKYESERALLFTIERVNNTREVKKKRRVKVKGITTKVIQFQPTTKELVRREKIKKIYDYAVYLKKLMFLCFNPDKHTDDNEVKLWQQMINEQLEDDLFGVLSLKKFIEKNGNRGKFEFIVSQVIFDIFMIENIFNRYKSEKYKIDLLFCNSVFKLNLRDEIYNYCKSLLFQISEYKKYKFYDVQKFYDNISNDIEHYKLYATIFEDKEILELTKKISSQIN